MAEELEITASAGVARPMISPAEAEKMVVELRELIATILVKDKHYTQIRGKDVLTKAGAEELGKFFGLSSAYSDLITGRNEEGVFEASVKCSVQNVQGRVLAESYGFYDSTERKNSNPNTVVKMAQKRAFVGAILTATGTSELFTQDVEDSEPAPARVDRMSSVQEQEALVALFARKKPCSVEEAAAWLAARPASKRDSHAWVAEVLTGLLLKPDPPPGPSMDDPADHPPFDTDNDPEDSVPEVPLKSSLDHARPTDTHTGYSPEIPYDPPVVPATVEDDPDDPKKPE